MINIPGMGHFPVEHVILDYNGTAANDGRLLPEVRQRIFELANVARVVILTADTNGTVAEELAGLPVRIALIESGGEAAAKAAILNELGAERAIVIGNGFNDSEILTCAALGICVVGEEGASVAALSAADIVCTSTIDAINLILRPHRLIATLRR